MQERGLRTTIEREVVTPDMFFSVRELREAAKCLKLGKAPEPDGISNEVLRLVVEE